MGAMYLNFIVSLLLITPVYVATFVPAPGAVSMAVWKLIIIWAGGGALLLLSLMRPSYGLWLSLDFWLNPWEAGKPPELLPR